MVLATLIALYSLGLVPVQAAAPRPVEAAPPVQEASSDQTAPSDQTPQDDVSSAVMILFVVIVIVGIGVLLVARARAQRTRPQSTAELPEVSPVRPQEPAATGQTRPEPAPAAYTPDLASQAAPASSVPPSPAVRGARVFISYRREDSPDVAGRIYDRLVQRFGKEQVFKDVDSIPLGVDFRKHLQQVVGNCDLVLAVLGREWLSAANATGGRRLDDMKDFVRIELEAALQRDIPVVPVLVRGASVPLEADLPESLAPFAYRNGIPVRADPDFHHDMDRLIEGVEAHLGKRGP